MLDFFGNQLGLPYEEDLSNVTSLMFAEDEVGYLAGVLAGAKYVVGNDTGPTHLAAHLGTPGLALFGSHTTAERTGIVRDRFGVIEVPDLAALSPQTVLERVRADLKDQSNSV